MNSKMTNNDKNESLFREFEFFNSFAKFSETGYSGKSLKQLIDDGMAVINHFPGCIAYSLYIFNAETFEFECKLSKIISNNSIQLSRVYSGLVTDGTISQALSSGMLTFKNDNVTDNTMYILPLVNSQGVIGFILIVSKFDANRMDLPFLNALKVFAGFFAGKIENLNIRETIKKNQDILDQLVAMKTMELTISKNKLGDKIEKLISNLSMSIPHEFRTPINQIIGSVHFLESYFKSLYEDLDVDVYDMISDIKSSAARLKEGFENYIYLANLSVKSENLEEIANMQAQYTEYAENVIYEYVNYKAEAAGRLEDITINLLNVNIAVGEEYFIKIISELISNSLKYSEKGTEIVVSSYFSGNYYVMCFHDKGLGFKPEQIELIEAFMQFDRTVYEQQGMGLGLSIVRKIIDIYRGEFVIESVPGEYTKVFAKLPYMI